MRHCARLDGRTPQENDGELLECKPGGWRMAGRYLRTITTRFGGGDVCCRLYRDSNAEPLHISTRMRSGIRCLSLRRECWYGSTSTSGQQYEAVGAVAQGLDGRVRLAASAFSHAKEHERLAQVGVASSVLDQQRQAGTDKCHRIRMPVVARTVAMAVSRALRMNTFTPNCYWRDLYLSAPHPHAGLHICEQ